MLLLLKSNYRYGAHIKPFDWKDHISACICDKKIQLYSDQHEIIYTKQSGGRSNDTYRHDGFVEKGSGIIAAGKDPIFHLNLNKWLRLIYT